MPEALMEVGSLVFSNTNSVLQNLGTLSNTHPRLIFRNLYNTYGGYGGVSFYADAFNGLNGAVMVQCGTYKGRALYMLREHTYMNQNLFAGFSVDGIPLNPLYPVVYNTTFNQQEFVDAFGEFLESLE